ncbi:Hpt domain-containing protein [Carboxylicivirga sp. N1Y90]|uniref:Hpt domain-containing protein n=1 Tax=Carboxylicivirga fragile TaxID=3417571 RepID=UPI003D33AAB9|nr:Hpt domain-containing protein [Marinilabiliaceae bacterium N1Y90]
MIERIRHIFINETSNDLCLLKKELYQTNHSELPNDIAEKVFRTMHTIKGSSPMFGFDSLSEVSRSVEQAYRSLDHGKSKINEIIIKKTKDVVALIEEVLNSKEDHLPNSEDERQALIDFFNNINRLNAQTND